MKLVYETINDSCVAGKNLKLSTNDIYLKLFIIKIHFKYNNMAS